MSNARGVSKGAAVLILAALAAPPVVSATQSPQALPPGTVCGQHPTPLAQPPAGSGPVVLYVAPCFEAQGNQSVVEGQT
ncbi:MAG TPA: hypothetical protein VEU08_19165, partial [Vicinamibacterales bacterium]|nr:hypothetical protein [Vicinamibacterales bacterium]